MSATHTSTDIKNDEPIICIQASSVAAGAMEAQEESVPQSPVVNESNSNGENVTAVVVTKAKRAATFLWILLHSQVCASIKEDLLILFNLLKALFSSPLYSSRSAKQAQNNVRTKVVQRQSVYYFTSRVVLQARSSPAQSLMRDVSKQENY